MKYKIIKEYYSREEIKILKSKRTNLKFNNKARWRHHFADNAEYNERLKALIESRIPMTKKSSSPIIPNGVVE